MNLLILGGTAFLGREVARAAVAGGHEVTCLARGESGDVAEGATLVVGDRDTEDGLDPVRRADWDAVVDVTRHPGHVRRAARDLADRAGHYVFVSTGNVYADTATMDLTESGALLDASTDDLMADMSTYGEAKVACEGYAIAGFGAERCTIARAGLIAGYGDWSGRSGYWPWRFAHPSNPAGAVLVPDALGIPSQLLDVRDLAAWLVHCAVERVDGAFNATGPTITLGEVIDTARQVAGHTGPVSLAGSDWLASHDVQSWMGERSLPLWLSDADWLGFLARDSGAAYAAGLSPRPLAATLQAALDFETRRPADEPRRAGVTDQAEVELLQALGILTP